MSVSLTPCLPELEKCMKIVISTAHDPGAECPKSGPYDWAPGVPELPDDPRIKKTPLEVRLRVAVKKALDAKGYTLGEGAPGFLVGFRATLESTPDFAKVFGHPEKAAEWARELGIPAVLEKGTLIVRLLDPATMRPIWCGVCQADIDLDVPEEAKRERLTRVVGLMFEGFPPPS
jgi:hypothetical protein